MLMMRLRQKIWKLEAIKFKDEEATDETEGHMGTKVEKKRGAETVDKRQEFWYITHIFMN